MQSDLIDRQETLPMFLIPLTRIAFVKQPNQQRVGILIDWVVKSEETEANWQRQGSEFSLSMIMSRSGDSSVKRLGNGRTCR
jgi:hypothetical protein